MTEKFQFPVVFGCWDVVHEARGGAVRPSSVLARSSDAACLLPMTSYGRSDSNGVSSVVSLSSLLSLFCDRFGVPLASTSLGRWSWWWTSKST